jgi:hypothetical protein
MAQDGASHTIFLTESKEQDAARWTVGMETIVHGLPWYITYDWYQLGSHWAPTSFDGNYDEQSNLPPDWATYIGFDYDPTGADQSRIYDDTLNDLGGSVGVPPGIFGPSSDHAGVVHHLFGDNNCRGISTDVDVALYMFLITRNGKDPTGAFFED